MIGESLPGTRVRWTASGRDGGVRRKGIHRDAGKRTTLHHFVDVWCVRCMLPDSCKSDLAKVMAQRRKKTTRLTVSLDDADYAAVNAWRPAATCPVLGHTTGNP